MAIIEKIGFIVTMKISWLSMDGLNQNYTGLGRQCFRIVCMRFGSVIGSCIQKVGEKYTESRGKSIQKVYGKG